VIRLVRRSRWAVALVALAAAAPLGGACGGGGDYPLSDGGLVGGAGGGTATVSSASSSGSHVTSSGAGGAHCGNGLAELGEQCDGKDLGGNTCATLGQAFNAGVLLCSKSCLFDTTGCKVVEANCFDGADDDKNGLADCADPQCAAACADPCAAAAVYAIPEPSTTFAANGGHPESIGSSCASAAGGGPGIVFSVTPQNTGVLDVSVVSGADLVLSVRSACGDAASEVGCFHRFVSGVDPQRLTVPCTAGQPLFVAVQGYEKTDASNFDLTVHSRPIACGDGYTDGAEACDDGNTTSGDGCSAACQLEPTEVEPNDTVAAANAYVKPWFGAIAPAGDVDVVAVPVTAAPASIAAAVHDLDGHSCTEGKLEGKLEILAADGTTLLASYDAGATDGCPVASAGVTATGTYYVRLRASAIALTPTFPYALDVTVKPSACGNGVLEVPEQCDDGNVTSGDGCSAACQLEPTEVEPNGTVATANAYAKPWYATIAPAGDVDVIAFDVPAGAKQVGLYVGDNGDGDCQSHHIVSRVELLAPDGVTVLGDNQGTTLSYCAFLFVANDASSSPIHAGKYYARVRAGQALPGATFTYTLAIDVQ
jgi:cysteine-rich repeat protein